MAQETGRLAENIVYFARALRAAGIPVGPGSVLDALAAVEAAGVGTRDDFYWTLHAVFVKRHEHTLLFDQAFRIFFRRRGTLDKLLAAMLPQAPPREDEKPPPGAQRVQEALFSEPRRRRAQAAGARGRRALHRVRPRGAAEEGLRADDRGRDRGRQGRHQAPGAVARRGEDAAPCARPSRPSRRYAPHPARKPEGRRRGHRSEISRADAPSRRRSWRCSIFPAR